MSAVETAFGEVQVGDATLTMVRDGAAVVCPLDRAFSGAVSEADWDAYRALYPALFAGPDWRLPVACPLICVDGRRLLVDAGAGPATLWEEWFPGLRADSPGALPASLAAAGLLPRDVDTVFVTHFDADHVGWLADGVTFGHARLLATRDALAFAREHSTRDWLHAQLERVETVDPGDEVTAGVRVVSYPGHVPGHAGLEIESAGAHAVVVADTFPHAALADRGDWRFVFDWDVELAAQTRAAVVEAFVDTQTLVVSGHFPGSGIGRLLHRDGRVVWEDLE